METPSLGAAPELPWSAAFAVLVSVLLAPLLLVDLPPILDYPNHLSRLYVLSRIDTDPVLSSMFQQAWGPIPDLAVDSFMPALLRFFPPLVGGRIMLAAILLATVAGTVCYSRAVFGRLLHWPLASVLVACNMAFILGFLNFLLSVGLALLLAAAWISWRDRRPAATVAMGCFAATALFLAHLMGLVFFLVLVASSEIESAWRGRNRRGGFPAAVAVRAISSAPILAVPAWLYSLSALHGTTTPVEWTGLDMKLYQGIAGFINYDIMLDIVSASAVFGFLAFCAATGKLAVAPKAVFALAALAVLYLVLPFGFKGTAFLDTRPAVMFGILVFGGLSPARLPRRAAAGAAALVLCVFLARTGELVRVWLAHAEDVAEVRQAISAVVPGGKVYVVGVLPDENPAYWASGRPGRLLSTGMQIDFHIAAMVLIERRAFWPSMFVDPAQQPLVMRPRFRALAEEASGMPRHADFRAPAAAGGSSPFASLACRFDYVLMLEAGADPDPSGFGSGYLEPLAITDMAALYAVTLPPGGCGPFSPPPCLRAWSRRIAGITWDGARRPRPCPITCLARSRRNSRDRPPRFRRPDGRRPQDRFRTCGRCSPRSSRRWSTTVSSRSSRTWGKDRISCSRDLPRAGSGR